ncbi:SusC/RagA family TonB-linked outer membrane protein [Bacteroides difficilis]|uniref:SusC/RagA family TonB-linked outer membrane protein n=1 Tax=Bacteroides difficilis TaxID=2763021 RepID=UPI003AB00C18
MKNKFLVKRLLLGILFLGFALQDSSATGDLHSFTVSETLDKSVVVSGVVVDSDTGEPLIGASVRLKGSGQGTSTDLNGKFTIKVPEDGILSVSYIGMKTAEFKVPKNGKLNIALKNDAKMLDEVVAIGYGSMKRSDLTGSVVSVNSEAITQAAATTIDQVLQGRAAGLQMSQNSGIPGGSTSIQIRGVNSINSTNEPIYVVDGVIISGRTGDNTSNAIAGINPSDIESIEILKDASATAIYGAQGANGVILITMKKGISGKPQINVSGSYGIQQLPNKIEMMNLREYARHYNERYKVIGSERDMKEEYSNPNALGDGSDWQDGIFRLAAMQNYNLSVRGGNKTVSYSLSGGYTGQEGIAIGSSFDRFTLRMSTEVQASKLFRMGGTVNMTYTDQETSMANWAIIPNALYQAPHVPIYNPDGTFGGPDEEDTSLYGYSNPIAVAELTERTNKKLGVRGNFFLQLQPVEWLTYRTELVGDGSIDNFQYFLPAYQIGWSNNPYAMSEHSKNYSMYWGWKNVVTANKKFGESHRLTVMLGHEMNGRDGDRLWGRRTHGSNELTDLDAGDANYSTNGGSGSQTRFLSFFGRVFYSYKGRYQFTGTVRQDGTSRFGKGNKWGTFPSAAIAWRVSDEKFMKPLRSVMNNLKFRLSYGIVGNSNVSNFAYQPMLANVQSVWGNSVQMAQIPNPDLKWESTKSWNFGVDLNFFNNRIELIFDTYIKKTNDLLFQLTLPGYLGTSGQGATSTQWANVGSLQNKGFEFTLNTVNISKRDFSWRSNLTFSRNVNKILAMNMENAFIDKTYQLGGATSVVTRTTTGRAVSEFYGYNMIGRINSASDYLIDNGDGTSTVKIATPRLKKGDVVKNKELMNSIFVGDLIFEDRNNDGIIDEKDRDFMGSPLPKFTFGFNNTFKYKDFDLSLFLYGSYGNKALNWLRRRLDDPNSTGNKAKNTANYARIGYYDGNSENKDVWNAYVLPGADSGLPRISVGSDYNDNIRVSNRFVEDASFLRIQNIVLGYNFPKKWIRKIGVERLRIYANVKNVYTFTKYSGYDPEIGSTQGQYSYSGQSMLMYGVDTGRCPSPRVYTFGLDLTF